jgi:hypothetical protein
MLVFWVDAASRKNYKLFGDEDGLLAMVMEMRTACFQRRMRRALGSR